MAKKQVKTKEEIRKQFLRHVRTCVKYWSEQPNMSDKEKCAGTAFSILVGIDGEAGDMNGFALRQFDDEGEVEGEDIAGCLHEELDM